MGDRETFKERQVAIQAEQAGLSKQEVIELMRRRSEFVADLDNLQPQQHVWVDRGQVMSCEGAAHPNHRTFKRR